MIFGISATQVTQLVAQKLTKVTLPCMSAVVCLLPSSSTKVDSGAACVPLQPDKNAAPLSTKAAASTMRHTATEEIFLIRRTSSCNVEILTKPVLVRWAC